MSRASRFSDLISEYGKAAVDEVMSALGRDAEPEMVAKAVAQRATEKSPALPAPPKQLALPAPGLPKFAVKPQEMAAPPPKASLAVNPQGPLRKTIDLNYYGSPVQVMQNPTPARLQGFLNKTKYKAARRIIDPTSGDVYVWDADAPALHALVAEQLGLKYNPKMGDIVGLD